jgi:hypothetical protein
MDQGLTACPEARSTALTICLEANFVTDIATRTSLKPDEPQHQPTWSNPSCMFRACASTGFQAVLEFDRGEGTKHCLPHHQTTHVTTAASLLLTMLNFAATHHTTNSE